MKKIMIPCGFVLGIAAFLIAIWLVQNPTVQQKHYPAFTPEETAVHHVKGLVKAGFHIDANTVEAIQRAEINDLTLVLVQYRGHRMEGEAELCEMVLETEKTLFNRWVAKGGAGLCHELNDPSSTVPMTVVSNYGASTILDRGYSTAFGYLRNEQIAQVVVTWEDGLVQPASVSARTYLSARQGDLHVEKIETFNHLGEIMDTSQVMPSQRESNP